MLQDPALSDVDSDAKGKPAKGKGKRKAPAKPKAKKGSAVGRYPALVACPGGGERETLRRRAKSTGFAPCFPGHFIRSVSCPNNWQTTVCWRRSPRWVAKGKPRAAPCRLGTPCGQWCDRYWTHWILASCVSLASRRPRFGRPWCMGLLCPSSLHDSSLPP